MISELTLFIVEAIKKNGGVSVFWAGLIEQVISPIPSVLIPMGAGFLLIPKTLDLLPGLAQIYRKISLPYALGASIGSSVLYLGSFYGGRALIENYGRFFGLSLRHIDKFRSKFTRGLKDELIIFGLIVIPVTPISLVAASCGIIGISAYEFYPLILLGTFLRSLFLGWLGWKTGETYQLIGSGLNRIETLLSVGGVGVIFVVLAFLYYQRQKVLRDKD